MVDNKIIEHLMFTGLSEYEARAYVALLGHNPASAYEVSRITGISTSKIYETISRLEARGMVVSSEGEKGRKEYVPLPPEEYLDSTQKIMNKTIEVLEEEFKGIVEPPRATFLWNLSDYAGLRDRARAMVDSAQETVLLSLWPEEAQGLTAAMGEAVVRGVRVASIHFGSPKGGRLPGITYLHPIQDTIFAEKGGRSLALVVDSREALFGSVTPEGRASGAHGTGRGFVSMAEDYIKHDIYVMKMVRRFDGLMRTRFGQKYEKLRDVFTDEEEERDEGLH